MIRSTNSDRGERWVRVNEGERGLKKGVAGLVASAAVGVGSRGYFEKGCGGAVGVEAAFGQSVGEMGKE